MAHDARLPMRNALVIPGALLTFYGLLAIIYAEQVRAKSDYCTESNLIIIAGICYTVWKIILPIVLIGTALIITGVVAFRGEPEDLEGHLHHGTVAHTGLALLISLVVAALGAWVIQTVRQNRSGDIFELNILGARYEHTFLLELVMLVALLMLVPFLAMYFSLHVKRRRFERAATAIMAEESDPRLPHERGYEYGQAVPAAQAHAPMTPDEDWPDEREGLKEVGGAWRDPTQADAPGGLAAGASAASEVPAFKPCQGSDGDVPCPNPAQEGTQYCPIHACKGRTREGGPCRNQAMPGQAHCPVHAGAAA